MRDDDVQDDMQDELIASVAGELRRERGVSPALDARIMAMIRAEAAQGAVAGSIEPAAPFAPSYAPPAPAARRGGARGAWEWVSRPRTVRVSPLAGLALAAALAALMVLVGRVDRGGDLRPETATTVAQAPASAQAPAEAVTNVGGTAGPIVQAASDAPGAARIVTFVFVAPDAKDVSVAGDFNDWTANAMPLTRSASGVWTGALPLKPGRYTYSFVLDGRKWVADPGAPRAVDDFGAPSSVLVIGSR